MGVWEVTESQRDVFLPELKEFIAKLDARENPEETISINLTDRGINPYQVWLLLEELGYDEEHLDDNGWERDFWIDFRKEGKEVIHMHCTGITFQLKLYGDGEMYE